MRLDDLIAQADKVIEKRASAKQEPPVTVDHSDDVVKLASFLEKMEPESKAANPSPVFEMTFVEKLACAVAQVEAINNMEEFQKVAEFEKKALESGYTQEQVDEYLEKKALKIPSSVTIPALVGTAAAIGGHMHGRKKGYDKAMNDVREAFQAHE